MWGIIHHSVHTPLFEWLLKSHDFKIWNGNETQIFCPGVELSSDPFDVGEPDPAKSGALESCLWELKVRLLGWLTWLVNQVAGHVVVPFSVSAHSFNSFHLQPSIAMSECLELVAIMYNMKHLSSFLHSLHTLPRPSRPTTLLQCLV